MAIGVAVVGILCLEITVFSFVSGNYVLSGPSFITEPPSTVEFYNTTGAVIPCVVTGTPSPNITWFKRDMQAAHEIAGLRYVRTDGSLVFPPFRAENYRQDVHAAIYHCVAANSAGVLGSREVLVKGVVRGDYEVRTFDEFAIRSNTAVFRCHIPSGIKDFVHVISWETDDGRSYSGIADGKFVVLSDGTLLIQNVDFSDIRKKYRCIMRDRLYGKTFPSSNWGDLIVTEAISSLPPRIRSSPQKIKTPVGSSVELPCVAQGHPQPEYTWYKKSGKRLVPLTYHSQRVKRQRVVLIIFQTGTHDSGMYVCIANNSLGEDRVQIELVVTEPLSATISPSFFMASEGSSVTFYCNVSGFPINAVTWKKNFQPLLTSARLNFPTKDVLHIASLQRVDKGIYQCFVYGNEQSVQGATQLALKEESPVFKEVFTERVLRPGSHTSLKCVVVGNPLPQISWNIYEWPVSESSKIRVGDFVDVNGYLLSFVNISGVTVEQSGFYTCTAKNDFGLVRHTARMSVMGRPYVHPMKNVTVVSGANADIECAIGGYPVDAVSWKKGENGLERSQRFLDHLNGSLSILQASKMEEDWYHCEVRNKKGERAHGSLYLKVIERPVINPFLFGKDLREGMRTTVVCSVLAGEPPLVIDWLKDRKLLREVHSDAQLASIGDFASSLTINGVTRLHSGNYTCSVSSGSTTTEYTATMKVNASPKWIKKPQDISVIRGDRVVFECKAKGEPEPVHRWKYAFGASTSVKDFRSVVSSPHMHVLENGSLIIVEAEKSDAGAYLCDVSNRIGPSLSAVIDLAVKVPPRFNNTFEVKTTRLNQSVVLSCDAAGDLPLSIVWSKDRRQLDYKLYSRYVLQEEPLPDGVRSEMYIKDVQKADSALFSCEAANDFGRDERNVHLVVEAPPDPPSDMKNVQLTSKTVTLTWRQHHAGNNPITGYIVQYSPVKGEHGGTASFPTTETTALISGLRPGTGYAVQVIAVNNIGKSEPSSTYKFSTEETAPSSVPKDVTAAATSSKSVKISWKVIDSDPEGAEILGYYVGYKEVDSVSSHVYKTVEDSTGRTHELEVVNLKRSTRYSFTVQLFNKKGAGPVSDEIIVQTLDFDPPDVPLLEVDTLTPRSLALKWKVNDRENPISGYVIQYRQGDGDLEEVHQTGTVTSYALDNLFCGRGYDVSVTAYNTAGRGPRSEVKHVRTLGNAPLAPEKTQLITVNSTCLTLKLSAWDDGGCVISSFVVHYKLRRQSEWILLSNNIVPAQNTITISDLAPASWYDLMMVAYNEAGHTEAEYPFATLTLAGGTVPPSTSSSSGDEGSVFRDPTVIVPITCAAVVLLVISIVVSVIVVLRRKDGSSDCHSQGAYSGSSGGKAENLSMVSYGKIKRADCPEEHHHRESLYYPTPYATTNIAGQDSDSHTMSTGTLRRIGRTREHHYDIPQQRQTQSGDYTQYAKLWTHTRNPSYNSDRQIEGTKVGMPLSPLPGSRSSHPLIKSCNPLCGETESYLTSPLKDYGDSGEFSETECDRDQDILADFYVKQQDHLLQRLRVC